jgi:hypothetical protein
MRALHGISVQMVWWAQAMGLGTVATRYTKVLVGLNVSKAAFSNDWCAKCAGLAQLSSAQGEGQKLNGRFPYYRTSLAAWLDQIAATNVGDYKWPMASLTKVFL